MKDEDLVIIQKALLHIIQELRAVSMQIEGIDKKLSKKPAQPRTRKAKAKQPSTNRAE